MGRVQREELVKSLEKLYDSTDYSDLTIVTGIDRHKVHKAIEALSGEITLEHDDPYIVRCMIQYFYKLDYPPFVEPEPEPEASSAFSRGSRAVSRRIGIPSPEPPPVVILDELVEPTPAPQEVEPAVNDPWDFSTRKKGKKGRKVELLSRLQLKADPDACLSTHAQVYAMADKYNISGLRALAVEKYEKAASKYWDTEGFPQSIHIVYSSTPDQDRDLRDIVVKTISDHMSLLGTSEMEATMRELNGLAFDVLQDKWRQGGGVWH
ncbi:hypothetical protein H2201_003611 [Coniosporium apollinis]|uniref:Uncharacterized protein n=1 Tax=Coniosporium apollinis TaxID=61459 RepID=A0ABQ9NVN7_9PEZI|nr:hypothetical protein H2201_003611 [Coniosporium apollinis]